MLDEKTSPIKSKRKKITPSSRKDEILQAYEELLADVETMDKKEIATPEEKEKRELLAKAETYTMEGIGKVIADLAEKFATLRKTVEVEKNELENLHKVKAVATTLKNLIQAQKAKEQEWQEAERLRTAERTRQEEEYQYQIELTRRKEKDEYEEQKAKKWKEFEEEIAGKKAELQTREETVSASEKELKELRKQVESFPGELEEKVEAARQEGYEEAQKEAKIKENFLAKEIESEKKLQQQKIATLEEKVKSQTSEIVSLKASLDKAAAQLKDIAVKVIEGQGAPLKPRESEEKSSQK